MIPAVPGSLDDCANHIASMARAGELRTRQVIVPNGRVAQALRRRLVERKEHAALAGTRFVPLAELARRVLEAADDPTLTRDRTALAVVTGAETPAEVSLLSAIPGLTVYAGVHEESEAAAEEPCREGRHGPLFASTVHRALELVLGKRASDVSAAVKRAAGEVGLHELMVEAERDVARTCAALESAGLIAASLRLDYPVSGSLATRALHVGSIDLLAIHPDELMVVDFKTDHPPQGDPRAVYPQYVKQVTTCAQLLRQARVTGRRKVRPVLLFTADGQLRWL